MWQEALIGGALIGVASAGLMALHGRIFGVSGIYAGLFSLDIQNQRWRLFLLAGLVAGGLILAALQPNRLGDTSHFSLTTLALAGLLVGIGTRLGSGCTSGHGVCGLARFSNRSLVATLTFMSSGALTVYIVHHLT